ncbi:MAG: hypothetical protein OEZ06_04350 [Myxococcales bacterium]|nr:hypothetical protein [Myxococcales bacterium]
MTREEIKEWLQEWLADHLCISPHEIEDDRTFASYRLDADALEQLTCDIEEFFEEQVEAGAVRARSNITTLTRYLCELTGTDEEEDYESGALHGMEADNLLRDIGL